MVAIYPFPRDGERCPRHWDITGIESKFIEGRVTKVVHLTISLYVITISDSLYVEMY
jgi:hypothetical protein